MSEPPSKARALRREPLLHFTLIGVALFLLYSVVTGGEPASPREIVVSASRVDALQASFARTWQRPPSPEELRGLVDDYVREEVYYREAIAMGLDRDDAVVRRRLRQKMEFLGESVGDASEPTAADLEQFLKDNRERFAAPPRVSFEQVFLNPERRGTPAHDEALRVLAALRAGRLRADDAGDPSLLPASLADASDRDVAAQFGAAFGAAVEHAPVGEWTGPIESGYGLHVVRVNDRVASSTPDLAAVRPALVREWHAQRARERGEDHYRSLRGKYSVRIETDAAPGTQAPR